MNYKITTLVENCVYGRKLQAEHGLSLYIVDTGKQITFRYGKLPIYLSVMPCLLHIDLQKSRLSDIISRS